jgi:hypothetical protein
MTAGAVIVMVRLLANLYSVDPALLDCIVSHESDYATGAQNGVNEGLCQWNPDTRDWLAGKAATDPAWLHGDIGAGPVQDVALAAWAIKRGYGSHWSTYAGCGG